MVRNDRDGFCNTISVEALTYLAPFRPWLQRNRPTFRYVGREVVIAGVRLPMNNFGSQCNDPRSNRHQLDGLTQIPKSQNPGKNSPLIISSMTKHC